jgi:3-oxoacyl-[acyl-carrier-protein] synthase II
MRSSLAYFKAQSLPPRRVVVTGLGLVTPLGVGVLHNWKMVLEGVCGIQSLKGDEFAFLPSRVAGVVPRGPSLHEFDHRRVVDKAQSKPQGTDFISFAISASSQALLDAGLDEERSEYSFGPYERTRVGVSIGSGVAGLNELSEVSNLLSLPQIGNPLYTSSSPYRKISPFFVPRILANMAAGNVSMKWNLQGPYFAPSTACASGTNAIGDAFRAIKYGDADAMLAGGTESCIHPVSLAGFSRLHALSTSYNESPSLSSRPFDSKRDGFVLGEGAGIVLLEEYNLARQRGARIYGEVRGYSMCSDAHHPTAPRSDGSGAIRCVKNALKEAQIQPEDIDYVNAHATSTPLGDRIEALALQNVFAGGNRSKKVAVSSMKGHIGHLLGAAGAVESIFTILALQENIVPPTLNLFELDKMIPSDLLDFTAVSRTSEMKVVLKNSFGFGGANSTLVFAKL